MLKLSAFLIVQDEEENLPACLESIKPFVQEIIIVDGGSTDETINIAKSFGAKVFNRPFDNFRAQKQFALEQATGQWVLSIDADEQLSQALGEEIRNIISKELHGFSGYKIKRQFYFLGHKMKYGGVGTDYPLRLFQRSLGRFSDVKVHESIRLDGKIGQINNILNHYSYSGINEYVKKCNHYTFLAATERYARGIRFSFWSHFRPVWELFSRIILKSAWLDGRAGIIYAVLSAHTSWLRAIKIWEIQKKMKLNRE